jgi:type II secretory pathway component PulC
MSIINEALKKIEPEGKIETISHSKKRKGWTVFIFLSLGLILILTSLTLLKKQPSLLPEKDKSGSLPSPSLNSSEDRLPPSLILKGIAHFGEENWAIIDEQIIRQGQFIKGAKVEEIFSDRVELTFEGKRFTLQITP